MTDDSAADLARAAVGCSWLMASARGIESLRVLA
jgi:hypothetical protein